MAVKFVFFDIGGTLGERSAAGKFTPFPSTNGLLSAVKSAIGLRMGVITTLGPLTNDDAKNLLKSAGLSTFFESAGIVSEHDVGEQAKPAAAIYQFAAKAVGVPIEQCLYVGENLIEVIGATAAGMQAILKPCPPGRDLPV
jgi:FMN phosphatase YigB (HAD superfamily)